MNQRSSLLQSEIEKENDMPIETQAPRPRSRARLLLILLLGLLVAAALFAFVRSRRSSSPGAAPAAASTSPEPQLLDVATAPAVLRSSSRSVEVVGSLAADEEVVVAAQVAGELQSLNVDFGSFVKQGQVIAQIDRRDAQLKVEQAQAALNQTKARLGMKEGVPYDPQQNADVRIAKSQLDWARMDLDRATRLVENGDIARSIYDQSVVNHQLAQARHQAALDQVQQQLAVIDQQQAALALARKGDTDTVVRAPISGAVKEKHATRGAYLPVNGRIVSLVRVDPLRVRADIPEASTSAVRVGLPILFSVDSIPGKTFNARVVRIGPSLNEQTRALTVEAEVSNPTHQLRPGMFARSKVVVNPNATAIFVPRSAVTYVAGLAKAFIVDNHTARERIVKTGTPDGDLIEILEGIAEGDVVATSNLDRLQEGARIR